MINYLYQKDSNQARYALEADYQAQFRKEDERDSDGQLNYANYLKRRFDRSKEIMAIAYEAKAMVCDRKHHQKQNLPFTEVLITTTMCQPDENSESMSEGNVGGLPKAFNEKCKTFHKSQTKIKLETENVSEVVGSHGENGFQRSTEHYFFQVFRAAYILVFAFMLCRFPNYDDYEMKQYADIIPFCYVLSVLLAQISMTIIKLKDYVVSSKCSL